MWHAATNETNTKLGFLGLQDFFFFKYNNRNVQITHFQKKKEK